MKVLLIAYACEPNKGSEPGVGWNWAINLAKLVNVTVITRKNNKAVIETELSKNPQIKIDFIYYDISWFIRIKKISSLTLKLYYIFWVKALESFIKKNNLDNNFDIIHFITFNTFVVTPPIHDLGIKSIWGPIGGGILGHLESFKKISLREYFKEYVRLIFIQKWGTSKRIRKKLNRFDRLIFANSDTAILLGYEVQNKIELDTGINGSKIISASKQIIESKNVINVLTSGVLEPRKGFHLLLDALKLVKSRIILNVLGEGSLKPFLMNFAFNNSINNVNFLGYINYNEVINYYRNADLFIFPSLRDTSGNVVLEAMSQGLPIISFDHQGMHDILTDECAIKIPVTNYKKMVSDIANSIDYLAENPESRLKMGAASIKRIKENYLWEDKAKRMVEIYKEVLNENSSSS